MKNKLIIVAVLAVGGIGIWFLFGYFVLDQSPQKTPSVKDTIAPFVQLNIPESNVIASTQKSLQAAVKSNDYKDITRVEYLLDGEVVARSSGPPFIVSIDLSGLQAGEHTLRALAYDRAGNVGRSEIFTFTILEDGSIEPSNKTSQTIIRQSVSNKVLAKAASRALANAANSSTGSSSNDNGTPGTEDSTPWPDSPPAQICGNTALLDGPATAPAGAVIVPAGDNSVFDFTRADTTYWFAPGTHTLGTHEFDQIAPRDNTTFIGGPGAILDGRNINRYAFTQHGINVKIKHLTVQNFKPPPDEGALNHDSGVNWTIEYNTVRNNRGGGVFAGTNNIVRYNCLKDNGQYGFQVFSSAPGGPQHVLLDSNEIVGNNADDLESTIPGGCGCTGAGKFWDAHDVTVTNNYVHGNLSVGLWADTNDSDFLIEGNYIEGNHGPGLFYEVSYNMIVRNNNFIRNGLVSGPENSGFPTGALYLSEAGGDSRVPGRTSNIEVYDNQFLNNWSGTILWENADRFCASPAHTSTGTCTLVNPAANLTTCNDPGAGGSVNVEPYYSDCRWKTQNVKVHHNLFIINKADIPGCTTNVSCGFQGLFSNSGTFPSWSPYMGDVIQQDITFNQNNLFSNNTYIGDWNFMAKAQGRVLNFAVWQGAPYNQDAGSTFNGRDRLIMENALDTDTATLEGSIGEWDSWFSSAVSRSSAEAHSGTHSLQVAITAPFGWGVELNDPFGFSVTPEEKTISYWAKLGSGTNLGVTAEVRWFDSDQNSLRTDSLNLPSLTTSWQKATTTLTPPVGSATASMIFFHSSGDPGNSLYIDDILIGDNF